MSPAEMTSIINSHHISDFTLLGFYLPNFSYCLWSLAFRLQVNFKTFSLISLQYLIEPTALDLRQQRSNNTLHTGKIL